MPASLDDPQRPSAHQPSDPALPSPDARPTRRLDLSTRLIEGEAVVLDRQAGLVHQLNATARYVWERCDGHATVRDIAQQLTDAFDVDLTRATHDVRVIVKQLQDAQLLESA